MNRIFHNKLLLNCLLLLFTVSLNAQIELLLNTSLEGDPPAGSPYNWETCFNELDQEDSFNDPNFDPFFTDRVYTDVINNIDGETFCRMRTRSEHYGGDGNSELGGKYEHISTELVQPLYSNTIYSLGIWLVNLPTYAVSDLVAPDTAFPLRFQVFGADTYCTANEYDKLVDTLITNNDWMEYFFDLLPSRTYEYIYFRVYWDDKIRSEQNGKYNGMMLLDKCSLKAKCQTKYLSTDTIQYRQDPPLQLTAPMGYSYKWEPGNYFSDPLIQSPYMTDFFDSVHLTIADRYNCRTEKNYIILFSCNNLYPENDTRLYDVYFKFYEKVYLDASKGVSYNWENNPNLSATDIRNPEILEYDSLFYVTIIDQYNCEFNEIYRVILSCDSLYQSLQEIHPAIKVPYGESIVLTPGVFINDFASIFDYYWSPPDYLSCTECIETELTSVEELVYVFSLTNDQNCTFTEMFPIELDFKIPNVITPGINGEGDGKNDVFRIPGLPENSSIQIFNKSGALIFRSKPYNKLNWWDGKDMNGKDVPSGTYWYIIETQERTEPVRGFILVIR